ncbi:MAG: glycosyltransferase [Rhodocyclaceae bacterium]|nr:glycosyltransferase [Rhodocyclaceae bacterium]MDZ4215943.1 glycosyltransferase [Rhodocyclaceae bacterium]
MEKTRILHLITRLPIGGAERLLLGILRNLDPTQFESVVCCIQDRGELAEEAEAMGLPVIALNMMQRGGHDRLVVPALRKLMRDQRIDLVHTHLYHANLYGRLAARKEGIPAIASVHNTYKKRKWYRHLINRWLARDTFVITAGSEDVERDLLEVDRLPKSKVVRLPNSIDLSRVETTMGVAEAKQHFGFAATDIVIGTVGRAEEQKGHAFLLEAFAKLRQRPDGERLKLLLVGDGRLLPQLKESAANLGIAKACCFPGSIAHLAEVYRAIDLFAMPSLWEGLSLAMLEAMASGLPIVATEVGGAHDVLGDNRFGLLVSPHDAGALETALVKLLDAPDACARMAMAGKARVHADYSVTALTQQLARLYRAATERDHASRRK